MNDTSSSTNAKWKCAIVIRGYVSFQCCTGRNNSSMMHSVLVVVSQSGERRRKTVKEIISIIS